jgi:hypothetical protein
VDMMVENNWGCTNPDPEAPPTGDGVLECPEQFGYAAAHLAVGVLLTIATTLALFLTLAVLARRKHHKDRTAAPPSGWLATGPSPAAAGKTSPDEERAQETIAVLADLSDRSPTDQLKGVARLRQFLAD